MPDTERIPNTEIPPVGANYERAPMRMSTRLKLHSGIETEKGNRLQAEE